MSASSVVAQSSRRRAALFGAVVFGLLMILLRVTPAAAEPVGTLVVYENEGKFYEGNTHFTNGQQSYLFDAENTKGFDLAHEHLIVYAPQTGPNAGNLMVRDIVANTTKVVSTPATTGLSWSEPSWTPGNQIIGVAEGGIYTINEDGSHLRRLTTFGEWPTMNKLGYLAFSAGNNNLYVISPVTSVEEFGHLTHITVPNPAGNNYIPSFNSNNSRIFMPSQAGLRDYFPNNPEHNPSIYPKITDAHVAPGEYVVVSCQTGAMRTVEYYRETEDQFATHLPCTDVRASENWVGYNGDPPPGVEPTGDQLLKEFSPSLEYDAEEPYRAIDPLAETNLTAYSSATKKYVYVNSLKRGSTVIADPLFGRAESETGYKSQGYFKLSLESLGINYPAAIAKEGAKALSSDYLDEHDGTYQTDAYNYTVSPLTAQAYGHAVYTPTGLWLQYWYYYYYNDGQYGVDDHEGDWEMVQLYLTKNSGYLRDKMVFAQHSHAVVCQRGEYETKGTGPGFGGRPYIHVGYGGHASYPLPGLYETEAAGFSEPAYPNLEQEQPIPTELFYGEPTGEAHTPNWIGWPGKWGGSTNSPVGPAFHKQWNEPEVFAQEAKPCLFNAIITGEFGGHSAAIEASQPKLVLSAPKLTSEKMSINVNSSQLSSSGVQRIIISARGTKYEHPPQSIDLEKYVGSKRVTLPVPVSVGNTQKITARAVTSKGVIAAAPLSFTG